MESIPVRSRQRSRTRKNDWRTRLRRHWPRVAKWTVLGVVGLFLLAKLLFFWLATLGYADVALGDDRAAVLYSLGAPQSAVDAGGAADPRDPNAQGGAGRWFYPTASGGRIMVRFDGGGQVSAVGCGHPDVQPRACPSMFGNDIGMLEGDLNRTFGAPDREQIAGGTKLAIYDDVGVTYRLQRFRVYEMELDTRQGGFFGKMYRFLRSLVP